MSNGYADRGSGNEEGSGGSPRALDQPASEGILSVGAPLAPARLLFRRFAAPRVLPPELMIVVWRSVLSLIVSDDLFVAISRRRDALIRAARGLDTKQ